ncbi:MAG: hypothetical protein V2A65_07150 [Candidatus Omnitrophota bacterium]
MKDCCQGEKRKKVLIITYFFPPKRDVGSLRARGLAKYLPETGWEPVVLTPLLPANPEPSFRVIETVPPLRERMRIWRRGDAGLKARLQECQHNERVAKPVPGKSLGSYFRETVPFPDSKVGWKIFALTAGRAIIKQEKPLAMVSISGPVTCHLVASQLKKEYPFLFWTADFRDLWTLDPYYRHQGIRRYFEAGLEKKTLANADALITVSNPLAQRLEDFHHRQSFGIPNGFDPDEFVEGERELQPDFTITYTGSTYAGKRNPEPLFVALKELFSQGKIGPNEVKVNFYGPPAKGLESLILDYGLKGVVSQQGRVLREEALKCQRTSQILLLLNRDDPKEEGVYTAKVFEYLAAGRPILAIGGYGGVVKEMLSETGAGVHCPDKETVKNRVWEWYQEWKKTGRVIYQGRREVIMKYSQRTMAQKFARILDSAK